MGGEFAYYKSTGCRNVSVIRGERKMDDRKIENRTVYRPRRDGISHMWAYPLAGGLEKTS